MWPSELRALTTPSSDSFRSLVASLLTTKGWAYADAIVDDVWASNAPNTHKTATLAWNCWLRWCREHKQPPLDPCGASVLAHARHLCATSDRPRGRVRIFKRMLNYLADLDPRFRYWEPPRREHQLKSWLPRQILDRAIEGNIRRHTRRGVIKQPYLDMTRVLESLKLDNEKLEGDLPPAVRYRRARDIAVASFAAVVPSRPSELAGLEVRDIFLHVRTEVLGVRALNTPIVSVADDMLCAVLDEVDCSFDVVIELRKSKTDPEKVGTAKRLQHAPGSRWSPARALLLCVEASRLLVHPTRTARPINSSAVFHTADAAVTPLSPVTISNILAARSVAATGAWISGRGWRPAAASWLLACGVPEPVVLALGGWKSSKSLAQFYVRHIPIDRERLAAVLALLPVADGISPSPAARAATPRGIPVAAARPSSRARVDPDQSSDEASPSPSSSDLSDTSTGPPSPVSSPESSPIRSAALFSRDLRPPPPVRTLSAAPGVSSLAQMAALEEQDRSAHLSERARRLEARRRRLDGDE